MNRNMTLRQHEDGGHDDPNHRGTPFGPVCFMSSTLMLIPLVLWKKQMENGKMFYLKKNYNLCQKPPQTASTNHERKVMHNINKHTQRIQVLISVAT